MRTGSERHATAPNFPIIFRFSQFKERDYTARLADTPRELAEVLESIAEHVSAIHASARRAWEPAFDESDLTLAGWSKKLTGLPAIAVGSIGLKTSNITAPASRASSLAAIAARHASGEFDLVAIGRPLLANPRWVDLVAQGKIGNIREYRKDHERRFP